MGYALRNLQSYVSYEAVRHNHIYLPVVEVAAFHVSDKIQWQLLEQLKRLAGEFVALGFFFADGQQPNARPPRAKHAAEVNLTHHGKLLKVLGRAIDVSSDIEQDRSSSQSSRKYSGQSRAIDARQSAQDHLGGRHSGAGIAGSYETFGTSLAHQTKPNAHGGITLRAYRLRRLILHGDDFTGMNDFDGQPCG